MRLDPFAYRGTGIYFLTMCCDERHAAFTKVAVGVWLVRWLTRCASHHAYLVHAYCVMPVTFTFSRKVHVIPATWPDSFLNLSSERVICTRRNSGHAFGSLDTTTMCYTALKTSKTSPGTSGQI